MRQDKIILRGAREHNLKNIDVEIPRNSFTVITGLSGSGKSSLAFDTIYAEGQRRYIECLSAYARQFLDMLEKPDVDQIEGLSPAISIEQKVTGMNPRSTVGTVTEIYDYLRLLYARLGTPHCYNCGKPVNKQSTVQIIESIMADFNDKKISVLAPVIKGRKGHYRELFERIANDGFTRVRVDNEIHEIYKGFMVDRYKIHDIEVVVDRLNINEDAFHRLTDSLDVALNFGEGVVIINCDGKDFYFSKHLACIECGISFQELAPNSFSFNTAYGACPECEGLGEKRDFDIDLIVPDWSKSINEEGILPLGKPRNIYIFNQLTALGLTFGFDFDTKLSDIKKDVLDILFNGTPEKIDMKFALSAKNIVTIKQQFEGIIKYLTNIYEGSSSTKSRESVETFMKTTVCKKCKGGRLKPESLSVTMGEKNISEVTAMGIEESKDFLLSLKMRDREYKVAKPILKEITSRLDFLLNVGLNYLTLNRSAKTLSGGESQRIRLATQIGSQLAGVLYVLDEPSIGLHQSDNVKLINSLKNLRDLNNTVIVVEHDKETMESSDYLIDLGPYAGEHGGEVCVAGYTKDLIKNHSEYKSLTLDYLLNKTGVDVPKKRRDGNGTTIKLFGAKGNNLKCVDLTIPLGTLIAVTGVSGSGKSTLINETLVRILMQNFYNSKEYPLQYDRIEGLENVDKVIEIDQSPIGRTPRSNPATYTGLFTHIRDLFAQLPEAKMRGYQVGRFSFNVKSGRCEACEGDGLRKIEMNFLPDVYVQCEICHGKRYNRETLDVVYKGKSISDVLDMMVDEAAEFFEDLPRISRKIKAIQSVGLGYVKIGQPATTLSGGEAQRVKLATELSKVSTGKTIYFLDEPTTGLHFDDVRMLLEVLNKLVNKGNTVVIVEHNLDVIKMADRVIDMGPEGGAGGGRIIAEGIPEEIAANPESLTGKFLKQELSN